MISLLSGWNCSDLWHCCITPCFVSNDKDILPAEMAYFHLILVFAAAVPTKILSVDIRAFSSFFQVAALHLHDAATLHLPEHMFLFPELFQFLSIILPQT